MSEQDKSALSTTLLNRLLAERTEAHRRYNEALSAVDRAIQATAQWPDPPPAYDEQKLPAINESWTILADGFPERPGGLNGKAFDAVWSSIKPVFERQMSFQRRARRAPQPQCGGPSPGPRRARTGAAGAQRQLLGTDHV